MNDNWYHYFLIHYSDVIMGTMSSQITSLTIVYSTVYSSADQRNHQSSASRAFVRGIHRCPVNSPHKGPVTRKLFPFDDVIMIFSDLRVHCLLHALPALLNSMTAWTIKMWIVWIKLDVEMGWLSLNLFSFCHLPRQIYKSKGNDCV